MCCQEICNDIPLLKQQLRDKIKKQAAALPKESGALALKICALEEYKRAKTVFVFVGIGAEPNTLPFISRALADGKTVCVPRCEQENGVMTARKICAASQLEAGKFGILQPPECAKQISANEIEFCVLPCLAADITGSRLGHGGGYYDRFLENLKCDKLLLCRRELLQGQIPAQPHDIKADKVITD